MRSQEEYAADGEGRSDSNERQVFHGNAVKRVMQSELSSFETRESNALLRQAVLIYGANFAKYSTIPVFEILNFY